MLQNITAFCVKDIPNIWWPKCWTAKKRWRKTARNLVKTNGVQLRENKERRHSRREKQLRRTTVRFHDGSFYCVYNTYRSKWENLCRICLISEPSKSGIPRVRSVKTQLTYCQLRWRHVSTQGVIIRPIIEPCLRYIKWKCTFGIPKCLQQ